MDDILDSEKTVGDAILVCEDLTKVVGGTLLPRTNVVLEGIPEEDRATGVKLEDSELSSFKTGGNDEGHNSPA